jgi:hypothetical protein
VEAKTIKTEEWYLLQRRPSFLDDRKTNESESGTRRQMDISTQLKLQGMKTAEQSMESQGRKVLIELPALCF